MHWKNRPVASITRHDVMTVIDTVRARGHQSNAHHVFGYIRRLFNFAIMRGVLEHSPCDRIKASELIGPKVIRQRVLTDDELRAFWEATGRLGYPYCQLYRLLLVTGQRRGEVNGAKWREFDLEAKLWAVPPERFKSNSTHLVPLSPMALGILATVPEDSDPLFSVDGFSKNKRRLDKLMGFPAPFVIHDLRRTVRTRLSGLKVRTEVAELIIGHGKKGLARIYDQHEYLDEMRDALDAWANTLSAIVARAN
ncbi:MAG: site-specific integrase [Hyphomicrobium sp.]